jgi:hypothetical protein
MSPNRPIRVIAKRRAEIDLPKLAMALLELAESLAAEGQAELAAAGAAFLAKQEAAGKHKGSAA